MAIFRVPGLTGVQGRRLPLGGQVGAVGLVVIASYLMLAAPGIAMETTLRSDSQTAKIEFFESKIRPLLVEHCFECHGANKHKGELRLDSRDSMLAGGESGPAVVPNSPAESLLIRAVNYDGLEMPPQGRLSADQVKLLSEWIAMGAPWSDTGPVSSHAAKEQGVSHADRQYWAFQPVVRPPVPTGSTGSEFVNPIDAFVNAPLAREGIAPNGTAETRVLVRRLFFDLTGLPPTFAEMEHWCRQIGNPPRNEWAYTALIDDLLNRPGYGEHWGRHWLDVVRFAQSNGYERDGYKPYAWKYRDYVVSAFQHDKPYNRFIEEQIAGDELPDATGETRCATGFYRLGVWDDEPDDKRQAEFDELDDTLVTIGAAFLGLTLGCARCHDHKFDPIPQADYYRLLAFLRNIQPYADSQPGPTSSIYLPQEDNEQIQAAALAQQTQQQLHAQRLAAARDETERKAIESERLEDPFTKLDWTLGVRERSDGMLPTHVLVRGNAGLPAQEVNPGFLSALSGSQSDGTEEIAEMARGPLHDLMPSSGRRRKLARWLASPHNPLTARVMVNRVWHYHFGRGLVASTSDFGRAGTPPSHPELLDWLASEFIDHHWSIKHLHRLILQSATYRRSAQLPSDPIVLQTALSKDPDSRWLWRQRVRRLDAESIRDSLLVVSGDLTYDIGGREMFPRMSGEALAGQSKPGHGWDLSPNQHRNRRSLYAIVKRGMRDPLLEAFDYANVSSPLTERPQTTVATQALVLLNDQFIADRSQSLARNVARIAKTPTAQVDHVFQLVFQREPNEHERKMGADFLLQASRSQVKLDNVITFRSDVPVSLFVGYRGKLQGNDYLMGPKHRWNYFSGVWGGGYEEIDVLDLHYSPFALWQGAEFADGELRGRVRHDDATEFSTLVVRGRSRGNKWVGIGVTMHWHRGQVELRECGEKTESSTVLPLEIPAGEWVPFRIRLTSRIVTVRMGEGLNATECHHILADSSPASGQIGVSTWNGATSFDPLEVQVGTQVVGLAQDSRVTDSEVEWEQLKALELFCRAMFNSNEFVYVD